MRRCRIALTGPSAAAAYELDGFRDQPWPESWCVPVGSKALPSDRLVRTRHWQVPQLFDDIPICPLELVVRHLFAFPSDLAARKDGIAARDRVELAVEHALRLGTRVSAGSGGAMHGDVLLRSILRERGSVAPTESYAETRAVQVFRQWGIEPWRQIPIVENGRIRFRADFMLPFSGQQRPPLVRASHGLLIEIDGREFHEPQFERDHDRGTTFDALGYHWVSFTPTQIETQPAKVRRAIEGALRRAGHPT